jgi:hypothetical protein
MDTERTLGFLLGLIASSQARSTARSLEEQEYDHWLGAEFFAGGLQLLTPQNPFDEEKGESRTPSSCTTTPGMFTAQKIFNLKLKHPVGNIFLSCAYIGINIYVHDYQQARACLEWYWIGYRHLDLTKKIRLSSTISRFTFSRIPKNTVYWFVGTHKIHYMQGFLEYPRNYE